MQREASPEPSRRLQKDGIDSDLKRQAGAGRQHTGPRGEDYDNAWRHGRQA